MQSVQYSTGLWDLLSLLNQNYNQNVSGCRDPDENDVQENVWFKGLYNVGNIWNHIKKKLRKFYDIIKHFFSESFKALMMSGHYFFLQ